MSDTVELRAFYFNTSNKARIIITLVAYGEHTYEQIRGLYQRDIRYLYSELVAFEPSIRAELDLYLDSYSADAKAFLYPNGRPLSIREIEKVIRNAHAALNLEYIDRQHFVELFKDRKSSL